MARSKPLPQRIRHLQPIRKQLATLPIEEVNESMDHTLLENVLRMRVKGLTAAEAKVILSEDRIELETWLAGPGRGEDRLGYLVGFLLMSSQFASKLLETPQKPPAAEREVHIDLPAWCKVKKGLGYYGTHWEVEWRRFLVVLFPVKEDRMVKLDRDFRDGVARHPLCGSDGTSVQEVHFGEASGLKCIELSTERGTYKRVQYALNAPGGHVHIIIGPESVAFDESQFEAYFHTLKVIPSPLSSN